MRLVLNAAVVASLAAMSVVVPAVATAAPPGASPAAAVAPLAPSAPSTPAVVTQLDVVVEPAADPAPDAARAPEAARADAPADAAPAPEQSSDGPTADASSPDASSPSPADPAAPSAVDPAAPPAPDAAPVAPDEVDALVAQEPAGDGRVSTPVVEGDGTQTVGVTWPEGVDGSVLEPAVRTLQDGAWSGWTALPVADEAPDPGTEDALRARGGTDAVWVGDVDAVQLSFASDDAAVALDDVKVALVGDGAGGGADVTAGAQIEPSTLPATQGGRSGVLSAAAGPLATAAQPAVVTRAAWGARNQACAPDVASGLVAAVVHHTATTNGYASVDAAKAQIRNIQAYHIDGRGWCDIGYNFLVDKWGNIYEGRANGMTQPVVGVHAGGFNTGTVGVSMLGDYTATTPSAATQDAVGRIIGWRLGAYGVDPRGTMSYYTGNGDNSRFKNQWVTLPRVFGHRDTAFTTCPGNGGYATLGTVRDVAARTASSLDDARHEPVVKKLYQDVFGRAPDPGGLRTWAGAMAAGQSAGDVARGLVRSAEYAQTTTRLDYRAVLGRDPDPVGFAHWTGLIASGQVRTEDLRIYLLNSQEFYNISGGDDRAYVRALYRKVLGRDASDREVSGWVARIPGEGRGVVMGGIWQSVESAHVRIDGFYQRYLQRSADPAGKASWTPALLGEGEDRLRDHIVTSLEYYQQAQRKFG